MKARDIIPGWPRGRSTTGQLPCDGFCLMTPVYWSVEDVGDLCAEVLADRRYHEGQERMVHEWHTKTGRFAPYAGEFKLVGF